MRRLLLVVAVIALLAFAGCLDAGADPDNTGTATEGELEIHHIDVGQGDATLFVVPSGETVLIDSGDWRQDGQEVIDYLEQQNIERIDHLVATHAHADHIGGHAAIIEHYEKEADGIGAAYDSGVTHTSQTYDNYLDAIEEYDVRLFSVEEGDQLPVEGLTATVLNPPAEESGDLHEHSVTLAIEFGEFQYLTTGDAEAGVESRLVGEYDKVLDAEVYQAGHHGSSTSSSEQFLDAVTPEIAIISSGFESQYGHPHDEILQRFAARGIATYWTGVHGDIVVRTDGNSIEVDTETDATTDAGELLNQKPRETQRIQTGSFRRGPVIP